MPVSFLSRKLVLCLGLVAAIPTLSFGQSGITPEGGEYAIAGVLSGDQVMPSLSLNSSGGYLVWEDNITDGSGQGISASRLNSSLTASLNVFKVNHQGAGDQRKPQVALLDNGGAVFVWQGGNPRAQQIYARFLSSSNTWLTATNDVLVNSYTNSHHLDATVTKLTNGNVVVAWSSFHQDGSYQGVYAQRFSSAGQKLGGEFRVAQTSLLSQRTPVLAGLSDGKFVAVWISETQVSQTSYDVSVYARLFDSNGSPQSPEFKVNTGTNLCANPSVAASPAGGFIVVWGEKDASIRDNGWDIVSRTFSNSGTGGVVTVVNTMRYGDQFAPKAAALASRYLAVWSSMGQDGSFEGVYGQFINPGGTPSGGEFRVNSTTAGKQITPVVAGNGSGRFLAAWSGFVGGDASFDLHAQRYVDQSLPLSAPAAPFVTALSASRLSVTWPEEAGFNVAHYELYVDGSPTPLLVNSNMWVSGAYMPGSTHTFRLAYSLVDGRTSPISASASGTTWGGDENFDGLPDDWQELFWGSNVGSWPSPNADSDGDGASNREEFLAGTDPTDKNSVLRTDIVTTSQGAFLKWNTIPGLMYQAQVCTNLTSWSNLGGPRFALGTEDSLYVGGNGGGFYRVFRLR